MSKKILIWDYNIRIQNSGGPAGYLYNIQEFINNNSNEYNNIYFLKDLIKSRVSKKKNSKVKDIIKNWINKIDFFKQRIDAIRIYKAWNVKLTTKEIPIDLNSFDIIHFHACFHLLAAKDLLNGYKGKIILTSHSPQPASSEAAELITSRLSIIRYLIKESLIKKEIASWDLADNLMFPVKEATEAYKKEKLTKDFLNKNENNLLFCPTGILDNKANDIRDNLLNKYNIPFNSFIITFIGRHNEIKGYDQLKEMAKPILDEYTNVYFFIAGKEYPIKGLKHKRWIELGWINYSNDLIAASDLFILPNKDTYFDLIALEVLRAGTPIMLTKTGGNKHFLSYPSNTNKGLFFYDYGDTNNLKIVVSQLTKMKDSGEITDLRVANQELFQHNFTLKIFLKKYLSLFN